jgi:hypothetical protein
VTVIRTDFEQLAKLQEFLIRLPAYFKQGKALKGKPSDNEHRPIKTVGESFILPYAISPLNTMQVALMIPCFRRSVSPLWASGKAESGCSPAPARKKGRP